MSAPTPSTFWPSAARAVAASLAVAVLTWVCHRLGFDVATTALLDLIAIVLLSLSGSFAAAAIASVAATLSINFFLITPAFAFRPARWLDLAALGAFLTTALVITRLLSRVRESLREVQGARDELRLAIDTIPALVWTTLPDGSSDFSNRRWLEYTGLSREQALDWGYKNSIHPEDYEELLARWTVRYAAGEAIQDEARLRRADGEYRWFMHRAVPLRDPQGTIVKWYGTSTDIEESKRAAEALREQAQLLNLTHDTVLVRDTNDAITYWNRGAEELFGWTSAEAIGQVTHTLLKTVFPRPKEEIMAMLRNTGRWEGELIHTRRDGTRLVVASRWSLQRDEQGRPLAVLETDNDVTERRQAERAVRRARERALRARFDAVLDERTRLAREIHDTLLQGFTGVALKLVAAISRFSGSPDATAALQDVVTLAQKTLVDARRAVWDLRNPSPAGGGDLTAGLRSLLEAGVRGTGLSLEFDVSGIPRPVDPEVEAAVGRVVQEVLTNVVKHAAAATVRARLVFENRGVRVSVKDDGRGFAADPSFQSYGGHWGLLGMRERVAQIRGRLKIRSIPGRGTEVVLLVPYAAPSRRSDSAAPVS